MTGSEQHPERPVWPPVDAPTYEGPGYYGGYRTYGEQPVVARRPEFRPYRTLSDRIHDGAVLDPPPPPAMVLSHPPLTAHEIRANRLGFLLGAVAVAVLWLVGGLTIEVIAAFAWAGMSVVVGVQLGGRIGQVLGLRGPAAPQR